MQRHRLRQFSQFSRHFSEVLELYPVSEVSVIDGSGTDSRPIKRVTSSLPYRQALLHPWPQE